jgi:TonB-dependent SusC/RagA subfamily outer membrane receptor
MKRKIMLLLTCLFVGIDLVSAQTQKITGIITSAEDGLPIVGATILVKGTTIGTITDIDGHFTLSSIPNFAKTLRVSYIGMQAQEVGIKPILKIVLKADAQNLDEVVVTGYGSGQKIGSVVGSIATVNAKEIENKPSSNVVDALQGKIPGVMIYTSSGEPSATSSIIIRGVGTLEGSTDPLIILDGVAVNSTTIMAMSPNDFESVSVLKDASATSIYGSRAANGVMVYTTKKGRRGQKGRISIDATSGVSNMAQSKLWDNLFDTDGLLKFWEEAGFYSEATINSIKETYGNNNTKWKDYYYQSNRKLYEANLSYSGGSENRLFCGFWRT